jgi:hypothetical protein
MLRAGGSMSIGSQLDAALRQKLKDALEAAFPSAKGKIGDKQVDGFAKALSQSFHGNLDRLTLNLPASVPIDLQGLLPFDAIDTPYYVANATHERPAKGTPNASAPYEKFVGHLPCVRVSLGATDANSISTKMGSVDPNDHLVFSVREINEQFGTQLGYQAQRVDLITPPRLGDARFGAISVYLGYQDPNAAPSFYILEAGLATGQAERLYFGKTIDTVIVAQSGYLPTPFSSPNNTYVGRVWLEMNATDPGELDWLHVEARHDANGPPYIKLAVEYERQAQPVVVWPALITAEAAMRVAAIGHELGMNVPFGPLSPAAAEIALYTLPWVRKPSK